MIKAVQIGSNVHNATVLRAQSTRIHGVLLTFLLLQLAIGWERCHQKRTKYQDLHAPSIAVAVLLIY